MAERLREIRYNGDKVLVEAAKRDGKGNVIDEIYSKKSELLAAIAEIAENYVAKQDSAILITETELSEALNSYVTSENLTDILGSYITNNNLNTTLDSYATTSALDNKVDKVSGKGLSTNDFTDAYKNKIDGLDSSLAGKQDVIDSNNKLSYSLINNTPTIPTKTSDLTNDSNYATESFVNSSVSNNTATFRGTYNIVSNLELTSDAERSEISTKLNAIVGTKTTNDYVFVAYPTANSTTGYSKFDRYKYNNSVWEYEFTLNNSTFTNAQWDAINSGITSSTLDSYVTKSELEQELASYTPESSGSGSQNEQSSSAPVERKLTIDLTGKEYPHNESSFMSLLFGDSMREGGTISNSVHFNIDPNSVSDIIAGLENIDLDNLPEKDSDEYYSESSNGMTMCSLPLVRVSYDHHESTGEILSLYVFKAGSMMPVDVTQNDFTFDPNLVYYTAETDPNTDEMTFVEVNTSEALDPNKSYFSAFADDLIFLMSDLSHGGFPIFSNYKGNVMGLKVTEGWQDSFLNLLDEDGNFDLTQEVEEESEENGETHTEYTNPFEDYVGADISFVAESFNNVSMIFVSTPALLTDANQIKNCDAIELVNGYAEGTSFPSMILKKTSDARIEMKFPVEDDTYYEMNSGFTEGDTFGSSITLYFDTESDPTTWLSSLTYHPAEHTTFILKANYTSRSGNELNDVPLLVAGNMDGVYFLAVSLIGQSPNYIWASGTNQELGIDFVGWNLNEYGAYRLNLSEHDIATIEISYTNPSENWNGEICGTYVGEEEETSIPVLGEYMAAFNLTANRFMFKDYYFLTIGMFYASEEIADMPEVIEMMNQNEVSLIERGQDLTSEFNSISNRISNIEGSYVTSSALSDELSKYSPDLSNYVTQNDISGFITSNDLSNELTNVLGDIATILDTINGEVV